MTALLRRLRSLPSQDLSSFLHGADVRGVSLGPSADTWVLAVDGTRARVLRFKGGAPIALDLQGDAGDPAFVVGLGKDDLVTVSPSGDARAWDARGRPAGAFRVAPSVTGAHAAEKGVLATVHADGTLRTWSASGAPLSVDAGPFEALCPVEGGALRVGGGRASLGEGPSWRIDGAPFAAAALDGGHLLTASPVDGATVLVLWALGRTRAQRVAEFRWEGEDGRTLAGPVDGRGAQLVLADGPRLHRVTVADLVEA